MLDAQSCASGWTLTLSQDSTLIGVVNLPLLNTYPKKTMASNNFNSSDTPFQTPDPSKLQSEETRHSVLERLKNEQGAETEVIEDKHSDETEPNFASEPAEEYTRRQTGPMNRTGG